MAKIAFSKLNKVKSLPAKTVKFNDCDIEIEQYLPLEKKVDLIIDVIEQSGNGEEGFFNLVKLEAYYRIEMIKAYTNISFTDKQMEDVTKIYDALILNDIWAFVEDNIPETERGYIWNSILALAEEITKYNNSILGVLKSIVQDYDGLNLEASDIQAKLADPQNLALLKSILGNAIGQLG